MALALLILTLLGALTLIPLGLPGTWLMLAAALVYDWFVPGETFGLVTIIVTASVALAAEVLEYSIGMRYTEKYGGSKRSGWGAMIGGLVGAVVGVPVFLVGSVIGAFVGAFIGALVFEYTVRKDHGASWQAAKGALVGRAVATAAKLGAGAAMAVWFTVVALRG
jgi:uncharacterized protein YqgC (DUF456 family)